MLEKEIKSGLQTSSSISQILQSTGYPKLLRMFQDLFKRLSAQTGASDDSLAYVTDSC